MRLSPLLLLPAAPALVGADFMNHIPGGYKVGNAAPGSEEKQWSFRGDYFEVVTEPMHTRYSEVYWSTLPVVPLPADVVAKYKDQYIVISGFEVDVKRINNATGEEESVPVYESYNHHYGPAISSSYAEPVLDEFGQPTGVDHGHGRMMNFRVKDGANPPADAKLVEDFVHGNGNEHRQIYHSASAGFGQIIYSPGTFYLGAMQINLNYNGSGVPGGPMPQWSRDHAPADAAWNPILECPCTTRTVKQLGSLSSQLEGSCAKLPIASADCFAGAAQDFGAATIAQNVTTTSGVLPPGCTVARVAEGKDALVVTWNENRTSTVACDGGGSPTTSASGHTVDLVDVRVEVDSQASLATITLAGPSDVWFGVGFNATAMQDRPYVIVVEGGAEGAVSERKLADHDAGDPLPATVKVVSSSVSSSGVRTVVLTRSLAGATADYYSFSLEHSATIPFINAVGATPTFSQHKQRNTATLRLVPTAATQPSCLCAGAEGTIDGYALNANCVGEPLSDLLSTNNPTCQVSTYVGGLACCRHGTFLLDADQEIPEYVDSVFFRFRFYYEDLQPTTRAIYHVEWAGNGCDSGISTWTPSGCSHIEFDVTPPAKKTSASTTTNNTTQSFQSTFTAGNMLATGCTMTSAQCMDRSKLGPSGTIELVMASAHCHAPNCIRQELWNVDTNELLCEAVPVHGSSEQLYDEAGYLCVAAWLSSIHSAHSLFLSIRIHSLAHTPSLVHSLTHFYRLACRYTPPCLWGSDEGLKAPPVLAMNTTMRMVTVFDNQYYHPGQMGIWQMKAAFV
jgi:hypothetical protein